MKYLKSSIPDPSKTHTKNGWSWSHDLWPGIPGLWSRSRDCDPWSHIPGYDPVIRNFWPAKNFDQKRTHGFHSVYTDFKNQVEFLLFSAVYHLPIHKVLLPSWVTTHPCNHTFAVQKFSWLWCSHLIGQVFYPVGQQFDLDFGIPIFERLGV